MIKDVTHFAILDLKGEFLDCAEGYGPPEVGSFITLMHSGELKKFQVTKVVPGEPKPTDPNMKTCAIYVTPVVN